MMIGISVEGFELKMGADLGVAPMLQWINISDLLIDPSYQRPVMQVGRKHILRIASRFSWSCFAPVIVSPIEGGKFAIIDGQHRTTAAALVGLEAVPCQILIIPKEDQAAAFKAINTVRTSVPRTVLHKAGIISGDALAREVDQAITAAGVELLPASVPPKRQQPGQTVAVSAVYRSVRRYGKDTVTLALQCITQTRNNKPNALAGRTVSAISAVINELRPTKDVASRIIKAFEAIDVERVHDQSTVEAARRRVKREVIIAEHVGSALKRLLETSDDVETAKGEADVLAIDNGYMEKARGTGQLGERGFQIRPNAES